MLPGTARDDDTPGRLVGDPSAVQDAFEHLPMAVMALDGPGHRLVAANAACRLLLGRRGGLGLPYPEAFPVLAGPQLHELLDRVYATGELETAREWRALLDLGPGGVRDLCAELTVVPRRAADGTVSGLLVMAANVTGRAAERLQAERQRPGRQQAGRQRAGRQRAGQQRAGPVRRNPAAAENPAAGEGPAARGIVAELTAALLPTALPVLPRARIAARYLVAGPDQAAGSDWFDAIPLAGGGVALVVGDVVGHGVTASAAMGQLRAVLAELLASEPDLGRVLGRIDAFATRTPALRAATLALAMLDPAAGTLRYTTCGHPPPLVIGTGGTARFLPGTGTGPLGTGSPPALATSALVPGELVLLYSDGLVERPDRTIAQGMAELAAVAAGAAAAAGGATHATADRVCQLTVELLTRAGCADDVTALAAQRLAGPVPALRLDLLSERASLTAAREAFAGWLGRLDAAAEDREALHLAMVEVVTNAVEHAYSQNERGLIELAAALGDDGNVQCRVTDHGRWRQPSPADADRGHGLMVAGYVVDSLVVSHPPAGAPGTTVTMRHRLRRPAVLASGPEGSGAADPPGPPFTVDAVTEADGTARAVVRGPLDLTTADQLARRLLSASRGGTVPLVADLTAVTQLASAGVHALYRVKEKLAAHGQALALIAAAGSATEAVLDLVQLSHVTGPGWTPAGRG